MLVLWHAMLDGMIADCVGNSDADSWASACTPEDTKALKLCWEIGYQSWGREHKSRSSDMFLCLQCCYEVGGWGGGRLGATCVLSVPFTNGSHWSAAGFSLDSILPGIAKQQVSCTQFRKCWVPACSTPHWQLTSSMLIYCWQYSAFLFMSLMCNLIQDIYLTVSLSSNHWFNIFRF
jgi:hypothetical protein